MYPHLDNLFEFAVCCGCGHCCCSSSSCCSAGAGEGKVSARFDRKRQRLADERDATTRRRRGRAISNLKASRDEGGSSSGEGVRRRRRRRRRRRLESSTGPKSRAMRKDYLPLLAMKGGPTSGETGTLLIGGGVFRFRRGPCWPHGCCGGRQTPGWTGAGGDSKTACATVSTPGESASRPSQRNGRPGAQQLAGKKQSAQEGVS